MLSSVIAQTDSASGESGSGGTVTTPEDVDVYMIVAVTLLSIIGCLLLVRLLMSIATCSIYKEEVEDGGSRKPTLKIEGAKVCGPAEAA